MNRNLQALQFDAVRGAYSTTHYAYLPGEEEHAGFVSVNHVTDEPAELASLRVMDEHQGKASAQRSWSTRWRSTRGRWNCTRTPSATRP